MPWPHYKLHQNVKQKSTCCVLAQQRWQKMTTVLINLNTKTKASCKLRKLILFVKQPENDYKQLASDGQKIGSSAVKHFIATEKITIKWSVVKKNYFTEERQTVDKKVLSWWKRAFCWGLLNAYWEVESFQRISITRHGFLRRLQVWTAQNFMINQKFEASEITSTESKDHEKWWTRVIYRQDCSWRNPVK